MLPVICLMILTFVNDAGNLTCARMVKRVLKQRTSFMHLRVHTLATVEHCRRIIAMTSAISGDFNSTSNSSVLLCCGAQWLGNELAGKSSTYGLLAATRALTPNLELDLHMQAATLDFSLTHILSSLEREGAHMSTSPSLQP